MKLNIKGLVALLVWLFAIGLLIHDFILLMQGATYTWYGVCTLGAVLLMGCFAEDYLQERLK